MKRVVMVGRLTKDPELRRTNTGMAVASFNLAINRMKDKNGEVKADFIPCVVWSKTAENLVRYTAKGSLVGVEGRVQSRNYQGSDGKMVYVVEVNADNIQFLDSKNDKTSESVFTQSQPATQTQAKSTFDDFDSYGNSFGISDDDIPF